MCALKAEAQEDVWIPSVCFMCYNCCGIKAHRVNGVVVKIEGDPENPHNQGKICGKGNAGIMSLYNPYRIKVPLKRTNPEKGIGVDPEWVEINWDEALDTIGRRLKKVRQEDPRKLMLISFDTHAFERLVLWTFSFGSPNFTPWSADYYCGNGIHPVGWLYHAAFYMDPDLKYTDYCMLIGCQTGFVIQSNAMHLATSMAEARARGMKLVVVDPVQSTAAAKADEWIPIRPGTDGAFALGCVNVLLNELGVYDAEFLKAHTNGPYLIGADGRYMRDKKTGKPFVWDAVSGKAVHYDQAEGKELALEGTYTLGKAECRPAFQVFKEWVKSYTPKRVSEITTVPAETIRKVAAEFGKAAKIGGTIALDGKELPLRPACVHWNRGPSGHRNSMLSCLAIELMNVVVGAIDVPGGLLGCSAVGLVGHPQTGPDGLMVPAPMYSHIGAPYPPRRVTKPERLDLYELFPISPYSAATILLNAQEPEKYGVPYKADVLIHTRANPMMTSVNPSIVEEFLKEIPFMVSISDEINETSEFADIVLPNVHYLESYEPWPNVLLGEFVNAGMGDWYYQMRQPVVKPMFQARYVMDVLLELSERAGFKEEFYGGINALYQLKEPYTLDPAKTYTYEEIIDKMAKSTFGAEHGLEHFKRKGFHVARRKEVEEAYPRPFLKSRVPLYLEYLIDVGEELKSVTKEMGVEWDTSDYIPMPEWKECPGYKPHGDCDLFAVNYKVPTHTLGAVFTVDNAWLNELANRSDVFSVLINPETADRKGVGDGDTVVLESDVGYKVKGQVKVSRKVHPEVLGIAGCFGHWASAIRIAKGKGVHWNTLVPLSLDRMDMLDGAVDSCVRVKVYKEG